MFFVGTQLALPLKLQSGQLRVNRGHRQQALGWVPDIAPPHTAGRCEGLPT
jgi:hypothetical protein